MKKIDTISLEIFKECWLHLFSFSHIAQFSFIARENAIKIIHVDFLFPICILKHENYDLA